MKKRFIYWIALLVLAILADIFMPTMDEGGLIKVILIVLGIVGIVVAVVLNSLAGRTLKLNGHRVKSEKFSPPDKFVDIGIYSCMRHPGQFGNIILLVSVTMLSGKVCAVIFGGWLAFFGVLFILFVEEREAIEKFGSEYCEYMKKVKPFSLDFGCIKNAFDIISKKGSV